MVKAFLKISGMPHITEAEVDPVNNTVILNGASYRANEILLEAPISGTIYGVLLNYEGEYEKYREKMEHPPYKEPPKAPILYIKPANTLNICGGSIPLPQDASHLQMGAALGVVFGKMATKVNVENALDYVVGYTIVNDVTIPHESIYRPAIKERARDGFSPIGPWVIDKKAIDNPNTLNIQVEVNGNLVQSNHTGNLIRPVEQLIADITDFMTFYPGDVLLVGVPENAPIVTAGDKVRIEIEGIGSLENSVVHENEWMRGALR
jgi:5-oxopent-3-ene-1,2,5-tricarboxylate decarboxylase / 2-hydroxyhepta-2,4-diene-1,7-dioate isomerase